MLRRFYACNCDWFCISSLWSVVLTGIPECWLSLHVHREPPLVQSNGTLLYGDELLSLYMAGEMRKVHEALITHLHRLQTMPPNDLNVSYVDTVLSSFLFLFSRPELALLEVIPLSSSRFYCVSACFLNNLSSAWNTLFRSPSLSSNFTQRYIAVCRPTSRCGTSNVWGLYPH